MHTLSGGELGPDPTTVVAASARLHDLAAGLGSAEPMANMADVVLGPPVPRPPQVFGVGLNYRAHAAETGAEIPTVPMIFTKFPSCLGGPTADVVLRPTASTTRSSSSS